MAQGPYGVDPGEGGLTLEPQGMPIRPFFPGGGWGPQVPFGPGGGVPGGGPGPGPVANVPMYDDIDGWPMQAPRNQADDIAPSGECPQPCPVTVRADLCLPQMPASEWDPDPFGDPKQWVPPGVRTVPEYTPSGVKTTPGGPALVGPGGEFVFPSPKLPSEPRGTVVPAGERVGPPGSVDAGRTRAPAAGVQTSARGFRIPWWAWLVAGALVIRVARG